jgi:hypothetical protein
MDLAVLANEVEEVASEAAAVAETKMWKGSCVML